MNSAEKITVLARRRKRKGKSKASSGRSGMLKIVMPLLSGDKSERFVNAVTGGDPDTAKALWSNMGDDLYQAVEMIRDENMSKARKNEPQSKDSNTESKPSRSPEGTESDTE